MQNILDIATGFEPVLGIIHYPYPSWTESTLLFNRGRLPFRHAIFNQSIIFFDTWRESQLHLHLPQFHFRLFTNYGRAVSSPTLSTIIFVLTLPPLTCFFIIPQQSLEKVVVRDPLKHGFFLLLVFRYSSNLPRHTMYLMISLPLTIQYT